LGEVQRDADGRADGRPERSADDVVLASAFDLPVGGYLGHRQRRGHGDHVADDDDEEGAQQPGVAHGVTEPQEEDRPEDRADAGQKDRRGPEAVACAAS
jgi:hypothetical protein